MASGKFDRELHVQKDPATCWETLTSIETLASWIDIVDDVVEVQPLSAYTAVLMDSLGPFKLRADLNISVTDVDVPNHLRFEASGEDRHVGSRLRINATLDLQEEGSGTLLAATGAYEVLGKVATLGSGTIVKKADRIIEHFLAAAQLALGKC